MSTTRSNAPEFSSRRFDLLRQIGAGGMGVVYEALDRTRNKTRVALKRLSSLEPDQLLLFKNEFRALQDIRHPNLVSLGELLEEDGHWFFTMELIRGVDFFSWVRPEARQRPASLDEESTQVTAPRRVETRPDESSVLPGVFAAVDPFRLRATLRQVADGVFALHAGGKIHRDLKPSNILVSEAGRAVVLDFGLVTDVNARKDHRVMGTVSFMAPEQAATERTGPAADWYAFGVLMYLALTGRVPFSGTPEWVISAKQTLDPPSPRQIDGAVPEDLAELTMALLQRDPTRRPTGRDLLARLSGGTAPAEVRAASVFVGRETELGELRQALVTVTMGRAATVLVHGESGQGKSALVREFLERLPRTPTLGERPRVLAGRCYERESVPYKALDEIVDQLSRALLELPSDAVLELVPDDAALLPDIFPVLARVQPIANATSRTEELDPQGRRLRSFAALRELLGRLARRAPLVIVIDDLQWADADSLALITDLLRPPDVPPMLLVATVRTASNTTHLQDLLAQLPGDVRQVAVNPLSVVDARELVQQLTADAAQPLRGAERIIEEAAGHPFFLDALVRYRLEQDEAGGPVRLDDALWWRIERLEAPARLLLELVAIAGVPIAHETAARAAAKDLGELDGLVAQLRLAKLVRTSGPRRSDLIEPYHDRVRETMLARSPLETHSAWHGRLALALEAEGSVDPEILGGHWRGSGDGARAARYFVRAAGQARRALAFARAARLYEDALQLMPEEAGKQPLRIKLADALAAAGHAGEAGEAYLVAADGAGAGEAFDLRRRAAEQLLRGGHIDRGVTVLQQVLASAGLKLAPTQQRALWSFLFNRLRLRLRGLQPRQRQLTAREAMVLDVCRSAALGLSMFDNLRGLDFQTRGLLLELDTGRPDRLAYALALEAAFTAAQGQKTRARVQHVAEMAMKQAEISGDPAAYAWVKGAAIGAPAFLVGDFQRGLTECDRALEIFASGRVPGTNWEAGTQRLMSMWCCWFLGQVSEMRRRMPLYMRDAHAHGDNFALTNYRLGHCTNAWLAADDPAEARRQAQAAMGEWSQREYHLQHFLALYSRTQIALYEGDAQRAYDEMAADMPRLKKTLLLRIESTRVHMHDLRARSALALAQRDQARAKALLAEVAQHGKQLVSIKAPHSIPLGLMIASRVAQLAGDARGALEQLNDALERFRGADMFLHATLAARRLAELDGDKRALDSADERLRGLGLDAPARIAAMLTP